jgi:two-component system LytT family response regulator
MICCQGAMNTPLKTIIVDDEASARRTLRQRLQSAGGCSVVAEAGTGNEALNLIRGHQPELVFLDIQMPGMDGFDVLRALPRRRLPEFVFMTAADDFAISLFRQHRLDYLLKPVRQDGVSSALLRARQRRQQGRPGSQRKSLLGLIDQIARPSSAATQTGRRGRKKSSAPQLAIRDGGRTTRVRQEDIDWIDAAGDYMCVHARGETYIMRATMKWLEQELDPSILQRIHRSAIVNVQRVRRLEPHMNGEYFLTLQSGHQLKLSRSYKDKLHYFNPPG